MKEKLTKITEKNLILKVEGAADLSIEDLSKPMDSYLFESSKKLLETKVCHVEDHDYSVRYIGVKAPSIELFAGTKKLATIVNKICRTYQVVGSLSSPIKLDLAWPITDTPAHEPPMSVFLYYIAFTPEAAKAIDALSPPEFFEMGGMPALELEKEDYEMIKED